MRIWTEKRRKCQGKELDEHEPEETLSQEDKGDTMSVQIEVTLRSGMDTELEGEAEESASELNVSVIRREPVSYLSQKPTAVTDIDVEACNAEYQKRMGMTSVDMGILETSSPLLSDISGGDVSEVSSCSRQSLI